MRKQRLVIADNRVANLLGTRDVDESGVSLEDFLSAKIPIFSMYTGSYKVLCEEIFQYKTITIDCPNCGCWFTVKPEFGHIKCGCGVLLENPIETMFQKQFSNNII